MKGKFSTSSRVEEAYQTRWPASPEHKQWVSLETEYHTTATMIYYHQFMRTKLCREHKLEVLRTAPFGKGRNEVAFRIDTYRLIRLSQFRERMEEDYW